MRWLTQKRTAACFRSNFAARIMAAPIWLLAIATQASAQSLAVDGVLGLYPVGQHSCIATEVACDPGTAISGVRWFHNDASQQFPKLLLMEGRSDAPPDLANTALILADLGAESMSWGHVEIDPPVTSSTGLILAVFVFPPYQQRIGDGLHGGPGLGYRIVQDGSQSYLSYDGVEWIPLDGRYSIVIGLDSESAKSGAISLAELKNRRDDSSEPHAALAGEAPLHTRLLTPFPNPFNPRVQIPVELSHSTHVQVTVFDGRGRIVKTILHRPLPAGRHHLTWLGVDDRGAHVASGTYFLRMISADYRATQTVTLLR